MKGARAPGLLYYLVVAAIAAAALSFLLLAATAAALFLVLGRLLVFQSQGIDDGALEVPNGLSFGICFFFKMKIQRG